MCVALPAARKHSGWNRKNPAAMSKMTDLNITLAKFAIQANVKEWKKKKILMAQFGSLFKLHTCADHKKRPVKAQPGKPQQLVYFYKHAHMKHREAHKFTCAIIPGVCAHYSPLIVLQYVAIRWVQSDCRRKWSSSSWWHCEVSAQSWAGWSSPTLRVSRKKKKERWSERPRSFLELASVMFLQH